MVVAAANPCPCKVLWRLTKECRCMPGQISRYQKRISGPILDRIDIHLDVPAVKVEKKLTVDSKKLKIEDSKTVRKRAQKARDMQLRRFKGLTIHSNSEMSTKQVKEFCPLDDASLDLLRMAVSRMGLSARAYFRVIKIARTIADLEQTKNIAPAHVAEALQYA